MQLSWKCKDLRSHCLPALPTQARAQKLMGYQKTLLFSQRGLINKKVCAEKTSSSWAELWIEEHDASGVTETQFYLPDTFPTQELAIEAAIQTGRQKIDVGFERGRAVVNG
jgi:hypothetical protein